MTTQTQTVCVTPETGEKRKLGRLAGNIHTSEKKRKKLTPSEEEFVGYFDHLERKNVVIF
eukprot:UN00302